MEGDAPFGYQYRIIRLDFVTTNLVVILDYTIIILGEKSMKWKKVLATVLSTTMLAASLTGCGSSAPEEAESAVHEGTQSEAEVADTEAAGAATLEFWTFVELHGTFFEGMAEKWNAANPDKQIAVDVNVMPYDDMHNKLQIALNSGEGTPDFVDIEQGKFSNFTQGTPALMDLTAAASPYAGDIVQSRMNLYSKDGKLYGIPTHVGATVAFYNVELLEAAGIDYTTIKTWDDFKEAGSKYYDATGKYLGTADTSALWTTNVLLAELGSDYIDTDGVVAVNSESMVTAMTTLKELQDANAIQTVPGGNPDKEEAYGAFNNGDYACAIMPMWQMSRYTSYMPDLAGKIAIAPVPVYENSKAQSVGGGGTGTAVVAGKDHADLAAEFLAYAKLSYEGNVEIWNQLGFDPCNMAVWEDEAVTHNEENQFVQYFVNNPFDVLLEIKDGIAGLEAHSSAVYPSINNMFATVTLNEIFENGTDVKTALDQAQADLENELGL